MERLESARKKIVDTAGAVRCMTLDLADLSSIASFSQSLLEKTPRLDILVNCGGIYERGRFSETSPECFDELYKTNVRGVYALTRSLSPALKEARGDIVFVNSTVIFSTAENLGQFAATQHALKSIANTIRAEVNSDGVRVLTIYPGRTATPRQERIFEIENKDYLPQGLLQPSDIAQIVVACLNLPRTAEVVDLHIRPRQKS